MRDTMSVRNDLIGDLELQTLKRRGDSTAIGGQRSLKRMKIVSASAALPHDTVCDILAKLPVRSILRFRCVCKSWNRTIGDPHFVKLQLNEARRRPLRVLALQSNNSPRPLKKIGFHTMDEETLIPELMFEREFPGECLMLVSLYHCDGLILLYSRSDIYLCNPSTREALALPKGSPGKAMDEKTVQYVGFGFDRWTDRYKVVRLFYRYASQRTLEYSVGCEIFTPGAEYSWRQVSDCPYPVFQDYSASIDGMVYWMSTGRFGLEAAVVSFDLSSEEFGTIRLPPGALVTFVGEKKVRYLMVGHGAKLWLVHLHCYPSAAFHIWELADRAKHTWTKVHVIPWKFSGDEQARVPAPGASISGGRLIVKGNGKTIDCYHIESRKTKAFLPTTLNKEDEEQEEVDTGDLNFHMSLCIESLVPLTPKGLFG